MKEEGVFRLVYQIKDLSYLVDGGRGLFHKNLNGGISDDGFAVVGGQKIFYVLGDGGWPWEVFAGAFGQYCREKLPNRAGA